MYHIAQVAVENATAGFDKEYDYLVPEELVTPAQPGCRCLVPFGGGNKRRSGMILSVYTAPEYSRLKPLSAVLDAAPLLGEEGLFLLRYIRETVFCTYFDALRLLIPAGIGMRRETVYTIGDNPVPDIAEGQKILDLLCQKRGGVEEQALLEAVGAPGGKILEALLKAGAVVKTERMKQRVSDERQMMARLVDDAPQAPLTQKQKQAASFLKEAESASLKEICYYAGVTRAVVDALVRKGVAEYFEIIIPRGPYHAAQAADAPPPALSARQQAVFDGLESLRDSGGAKTALLYGVTGSGKTEVFLGLVERAVRAGKTAIVLVPEISLTAQAVESFQRRFGARVAVLHSGLSLGERMDEWRRIRDGGADVVVGTRSAVFAPAPRLGLIVIDEEQELTYKSDKTPRYHARDIALTRCRYHGAMLLLSSATPSIESYYAAKSGKYHLFTLNERFNQCVLPDVEIVDMKDVSNTSAYPSLSSVLLEELHYNLEHGEQSILLLNRRGHSTLVKCSSCGTVAECPNCSVALTYHAANGNLICHYCGYARPADGAAVCAACDSKLVRYAGLGTQKLEEELNTLFPNARVLRVDMDTTMSKHAHSRLFTSFADGDYDIMLGTQMVAKGLNFPNVTLVGVLGADQSLYSGDFRSFERTFSLLTQVVGRGGRGGKRGRACIQTYAPENPVIRLAAEQDYPAFYEQEIRLRKLHLYPPFCALCGVGFSGENEAETRRWAERFAERFKLVASENYSDLPVRLLGPSQADVFRVSGKYRYKLVIKCRNDARTRELLRALLAWFMKESKKVGCSIDMHYSN